MTRHPKARSRARLLRSLYIWHRYLGLTAALFVVLLCITGIALNHTETLRLDSRYMESDILLDWYGIHAPATISSFRAGAASISRLGERIYWNTRLVPAVAPSLSGAVAYAGLVVVALDDRVLLFTRDGELIEELGPATGVPAGIQAVGTDNAGGLVIKTIRGNYRTDENFLEWTDTTDNIITWAASETPAPELAESLRNAWRGKGLTVERVLLDLHSGRIFGEAGVWLIDTAALLFLVLACSGVWLWGRRRASTHQHQRSSHLPGQQ